MIKYNPEKHYLGELCRNKHEYKNTGQSLRYIKSMACVECQKAAMTRYMNNYKEAQSA